MAVVFSLAAGMARAATEKPLHLVSDIDDTLKRTHVLSKIGMIVNGPKSTNSFSGMSELYTVFLCHPLAKAPAAYGSCLRERETKRPEAWPLSYVTAAPGVLQTFARAFLEKSLFPAGGFYGRSLDAERAVEQRTFEFKVETISRLADERPGMDLVLVGDNGQADVAAFAAVEKSLARRRPEQKVLSYVHAVYDGYELGVRLEPGQIGYATAADLALHFHAAGWLSDGELGHVLRAVTKALAADAEDVFPKWMDCRLSLDSLPSPPLGADPALARAAEKVLRTIRSRCSLEPLVKDPERLEYERLRAR